MDVFNHAIPRSRFRLLELHLYPIVLLDPRCVSSPSSCWVVLLRFTCFSPRSTLAHIFRMYALIHWSPTVCKIFRHESQRAVLVPYRTNALYDVGSTGMCTLVNRSNSLQFILHRLTKSVWAHFSVALLHCDTIRFRWLKPDEEQQLLTTLTPRNSIAGLPRELGDG